ncbi:MAG: hypothetical protein LUI14_00080 [Lachnospiraceae bacterium]|nr:hypothetical protein [Lachnospiraceae bacterium]MCD7766322.1 hypothetical protein [Lachnospiraceae bacterium]
MADSYEYINKSYDTLVKLISDEKERLECKERETDIRDYNTGVHSVKKQSEETEEALDMELGLARGLAQSIAQGMAQGITMGIQIITDHDKGISNEEIAENRNIPLAEVNQFVMQYESA